MEDSFLHVVWMGSAVLAILSIFVLSVLIVRRLIFAKKIIATAERREELSEYFEAALCSPVVPNAAALPKLERDDAAIVIQVALDFMRTIQGQDIERIVSMMWAWNLFPHLVDVSKYGARGVRIQALTLLAHFDDGESLDLLFEQAEDEDPYIQLSALRSLALRNIEQSEIARIIAGLGSSNQTNVLILADILKKFGAPAIQSLHDLATSSDNLPGLISSDDDTSWWKRFRAAEALGRPKVAVRVAAIVALGNIGSLTSVAVLMRLLKDPHAEIRANSAVALGEIEDDRAAEALGALLGDPDAQVRTCAATGLGLIQADSSLPQLLGSLEDEAWWVRFRAAEALYKFGDSGIALLRAVSKKQSPAGTIAFQVLAEMVDV